MHSSQRLSFEQAHIGKDARPTLAVDAVHFEDEWKNRVVEADAAAHPCAPLRTGSLEDIPRGDVVCEELVDLDLVVSACEPDFLELGFARDPLIERTRRSDQFFTRTPASSRM